MRKKISYIAISESLGTKLPAYVKVKRVDTDTNLGYDASANSANRIIALMRERGAEPDIGFINGKSLWIYYWDPPQIARRQEAA